MYGFALRVLILNAGSKVSLLTNLGDRCSNLTTSEKSSSVVVQLDEADSLQNL